MLVDAGEKRKKHIDCIDFSKKLFMLVLILIFGYFILGQALAPDEREQVDSEFEIFETQWQQVLEDGTKVPVEVPGKVEAKQGEVVTLVTTLPEHIYRRENLCFRVIWQDVNVYIDGELRKSYNTKGTRPFGTNSAMRNVFVELKESDGGKELRYEFSSNSKYAGVMRTSYIGDKASIWFYYVKDSGVRTLVAMFLLLMGLFCIIVCTTLQLFYQKHLNLVYFAWAVFLCSLWMLSEAEFRQLIFKNVSVLTSYTYWSLMLLPFPFIIYINDIQKGYYQKAYRLPLVYSTIILIVGTVLQLFDVVQFVTMLPFIHVGVALAIGFLIGTITIDFVKKRASDYIFVGIGIYGMLFSALIEMTLYYIDVDRSLGTVLSFGLMFLMVMAIIKTGQDFLATEKKRQQADMARKAQAQFLANMSHEIRTPINAVIGMNEMILRENTNETIQEYAHNINSASSMLLGLVNDVLDFSKIESGQLELVEENYHLVSLIQDEILLMNTRAKEKQLSTLVEVDKNIPSMLYGDKLRIKQILTNLLSNAIKYTKHGSVTLKVFYKTMDLEHIQLCFSVIDTGCGVKEEDLPKLFDSFKRLELNRNRNIEGTGLGLNITKGLVDIMNGNIKVESQYKKGSTFTVEIPQRVIEKRPVGEFESALKRLRQEKRDSMQSLFIAPGAKVLIVDDNAMNLSVVKGLLKQTKIVPDLAKSGEEALELTRKQAYHVILMDHMMPGMNGVEALHLLRKEENNPNRDTIVIALTANAIAGCKEMYLQYGFDDYFSKPIQIHVLEKMLLQYLPEDLVSRLSDDEEDGK